MWRFPGMESFPKPGKLVPAGRSGWFVTAFETGGGSPATSNRSCGGLS